MHQNMKLPHTENLLSFFPLPNFQSPPSTSLSDSTFLPFYKPSTSTLYSLIHNTASACSIFRDQQVLTSSSLLTMSPKPLNPNARPFFHFPSKTYSKPLNPNANPFQTQTYFCVGPSWQCRPFIPRVHNKVTKELPRVRRFVRSMNHNIPISWRKHHVVSRRAVHVRKPKSEEHKDQRIHKSLESKKMSSKGDVIPFPSCPSNQKPSCTTVMIKNIPNQFRRTALVNILRSHCRNENKKSEYKSAFDFVYLPMDFQKYWEKKRVTNLGYAFVNFTSHVAAVRFHRYYHNRAWNVKLNNKVCEITCAKIQGKQALMRQFENSVFWCHTDMYLPAVLEPACDGESLPELINIGCRVCAPSRRPRVKK